jgi:hypothetical protein
LPSGHTALEPAESVLEILSIVPGWKQLFLVTSLLFSRFDLWQDFIIFGKTEAFFADLADDASLIH